MDLTDQQWQVVAPLFLLEAAVSEQSHKYAGKIGRPSYPPRSILDAVLWKIRTASPWYHLPAVYPSHQSVYRRYRRWRRIHLLDQIFLALYADLVDRGDFNLQNALLDGSISVQTSGIRLKVLASVDIQDTWQLSTGLVFIQIAVSRYRKNRSSYRNQASR
jgi:transposase